MFTITLTKQQLQNLKVFLDRVDLKGNEVPAYYDVARAIYAASSSEEPLTRLTQTSENSEKGVEDNGSSGNN